MTMRIAIFAACAALPLLPAPPAGAAELIDARDPPRLAEAVRAYGYRAELDVDGAGDPMIRTSVEGLESLVFFFGCTAAKDCRSILLRIGFDLADGSDLAAMNQWNRKNLVGRAFLDDEGDPWIEHFVTLEGGVSEANLRALLGQWGAAVRDFRVHIDF